MARIAGLAAVPLVLAAAAGWAQPAITVQLHHRNAESLITALRPLIGPATLAGAGMQLQVTAPPSDAARVMRLIEQSDRPLQPLVVRLSAEFPSALSAPAGSSGAQAGELRAKADDRSVTLSTGAMPPDPHGNAQVLSTGRAVPPDPHGNAQVLSTGRAVPPDPHGNAQVLSTGRAMPPDPHGNAQVLSTRPGTAATELFEGDPVRISMPASQSLWVGVKGRHRGPNPSTPAAAPGGTAGSRAAGAASDVAAVVHFDAVSDFTARIWVAGDTVAIDLSPLAAGRVDGAPDPNVEPVTVYGRLGRWIALADSGPELPSTDSAESGAPRAGLWIKVERAPRPPGLE
jgi:hypothetical protein